MKTIVFDAKEKIDEELLVAVTQLLEQGEVVAIPTETVYGLAADARNETAVQKIFAVKGRPSDNPLIVHVATKEQINDFVTDVPTYVEQLIAAFSPGPITYVLKKRNQLAPSVTAGLDTVALRIPNHPVAQAILQYSKLPLAAPSANLSGRPSPTEAKHVWEDLAGKISAIVDGGRTQVGLESTVLDCTGDIPQILRPGMITQAEIANVVGACTSLAQAQTAQPKSPGLKYTHYAPNVPLFLVVREKIAPLISEEQAKGKRVALLYFSAQLNELKPNTQIWLGASEVTIAQNVYKALRDSEKMQVDLIVCEMPESKTNAAIFDRLSRAAAKIIM